MFCSQIFVQTYLGQERVYQWLTTCKSPVGFNCLQVNGGFAEKPKSRRKRANSVKARIKRAESLVQTQPDLRAKFYSKVCVCVCACVRACVCVYVCTCKYVSTMS